MTDELLEDKLKRLRALSALSFPVETIELNPVRRSENLRLLRAYMSATQSVFSRVLKISSPAMYSNYETGKKHLPAGDARRIESELGLPKGWFERNHADDLFLSPDEVELIAELRRSQPNATKAFLNAIRSIRANGQRQ